MPNHPGYIQSTFSPGVPEGPMRGPGGSTLVPSSFGARHTTFGPQFSAHEALRSERARVLAFREAYHRCTHQDAKIFDWQGRANPRPGELSHQPLLGAQLPTQYVPLDMRRPNDPYRLAPLIVTSFTAMVFGEGMWPSIDVAGDARTQDFARALATAQGLPAAMTKARNVGGSTGTVGLSWRFCRGAPRVAVHRPQFLHVHEWDDFERLIPAHVTKLLQVWRPVVMRDGRRTQMLFWQRRDWTPDADVTFVEEPVDPKHEPEWQVDAEQTHEHGDGFCHFVWIRNLEDTDESAVDGLPDYDALYENMGTLDVLSSVVTRGGVLNLDPTLKLRMDPEVVNRYGVRKGSDNALIVGETGDADYMELDGTSLTTGTALIGQRRAHALEVSQCVVPDPNTVAAAGASSVALRMLYRPMLSRANLMRNAYGGGIRELLGQQIDSARVLLSTSVPVPEDIEPAPSSGEREAPEATPDAPEEIAPETGSFSLALPPRVVEEPEVDEQGNETGSIVLRFEEREPGEGGDLELAWPDYFEPTPDDRQKEVTTLSVASGGKPVMSHRTAVEKAARFLGVDPAEEWRRVSEQLAREKQVEGLMWPETGLGAGPAPEEPGDLFAGGGESAPGDEAIEGAVPAPEAQADPLAAPGPAQVVKVSPGFVLNGAQIQAAIEIVKLVETREIPRDAGLGQLEILFNLPAAAALKLMGSAGLEAPTAPPPAASLPPLA